MYIVHVCLCVGGGEWSGSHHAHNAAHVTHNMHEQTTQTHTLWLAALVAPACIDVCLHTSAIRLLVSLLLAVPAFTIKLAGRLLFSLFALASLRRLTSATLALF